MTTKPAQRPSLSFTARNEMAKHYKKEYIGIERRTVDEEVVQIGTAGAMLDSGAYTAWTQGVEIDLSEYADFLLEHQESFQCVVNLDVLPVALPSGRVPLSEFERTCVEGWKNYEYLIKRGVDPEKLIHVFHQGEDYSWLRRFLDDGVKYVGLSPRKGSLALGTHEDWLDGCMRHLTDDEGIPVCRFHGFGISSFATLRRYPWYSVDSSDAGKKGTFGIVMMPAVGKDGNWRYDVPPVDVIVTLHRQDQNSIHFNPQLYKTFERYCEEKGCLIGRSELTIKEGEKVELIYEEGLSNNTLERIAMNMRYMSDLMDTIPDWPWAFKPRRKRGLVF